MKLGTTASICSWLHSKCWRQSAMSPLLCLLAFLTAMRWRRVAGLVSLKRTCEHEDKSSKMFDQRSKVDICMLRIRICSDKLPDCTAELDKPENSKRCGEDYAGIGRGRRHKWHMVCAAAQELMAGNTLFEWQWRPSIKSSRRLRPPAVNQAMRTEAWRRQRNQIHK